MAIDKKKIIVYTDWLSNFEDLTDEELGKLMRHFFMYVNDLNPVLEDRLLKLVWKPIENTLKRDLIKWEQRAENSRKNGGLGGRPRKNPTEPKKPSGLIDNPTEPKKPVSVSDSVSVSVNIDNAPSVTPKASIDFVKLLEFINEKTKRTGNSKFKVVNKAVRNKYKARLKDGYTKDNIIQAITNAVEDQYHKEVNYKYLTPEFFSRSEMIDKHGFKTKSTKNEISLADWQG